MFFSRRHSSFFRSFLLSRSSISRTSERSSCSRFISSETSEARTRFAFDGKKFILSNRTITRRPPWYNANPLLLHFYILPIDDVPALTWFRQIKLRLNRIIRSESVDIPDTLTDSSAVASLALNQSSGLIGNSSILLVSTGSPIKMTGKERSASFRNARYY